MTYSPRWEASFGPFIAGGDVIGVASGGTFEEAVSAALTGRYEQIVAEALLNDGLLVGDASDMLRITGNNRVSGGKRPDVISGGMGQLISVLRRVMAVSRLRSLM